jgi:hypothetical protein
MRTFIFASALSTVLLAAITLPLYNPVGAADILFNIKFKDKDIVAQKTVKDGDVTTFVSAEAFRPVYSDVPLLCASVIKTDDRTNTLLNYFTGCGPVHLEVAGSLGSARFSGTIAGTDYVNGEEKTVTANSHLTATGKIQTRIFTIHSNNGDFLQEFHQNGQMRTASGSLSISGDFAFGFNDAEGIIGNVKGGGLVVLKN